MKENISKNKVWQIVGISVLCAVLVLGAVLSIVFGMHHNITDNQVLPKDMSDKPDDSVVIETQGECGISLLYGSATTSADGSTTRTITATVEPNDADNKAVDWSVAFKNASSAWATGKSVTDYVTIVPASDGALTATVTCKQAFGEQIVITCSSRESADISASATVDYEKKVIDLTCQLQRKTNSTEYSDVTVIDMSEGYTYRCVVSPVYSAYTIDKSYSDGSTYGVYYFHSLWVGGYVLFYVLFVGVPLALIIWLLIALNLKGQNVDYGAETKPLILYKRFENKVIGPVTFVIKDFIGFIKESKLWKIVWGIIIVFSLNIVTIAIECFAFYYTILGGFSSSAYIAVYKLFVDLSVLSRVPIAVWIIVALVVVSIWRKKTGYRRLRRREMLNRKIIETLSTFVIFFATMGAGKTLTMTDVILSQQQKLRDDAKDIMSEVDFAFPDFPWAEFEQDMKYRMNEHVVEKKNCFGVVVARRVIRPTLYNLQSIEACFDNLKKSGERYFTDEKYRMFYDKAVRRGKLKPILWGYDVAQYGIWYDNALKYESIYDALRDYAQAYFIYSMTTSMIFSNYSVVTKDEIDDAGNFPLWITDFFEVPTFDSECPSMNSHILDNDMLRLGKKFDENNKFKDSFEFGALAYTEGDKERGNMLENLELRKTSEEVNQKNDNFNAMFKMSRHPATIRNRKFFFAYMDMQRTGSINADLKEIGDNVRIDSVDSIKMLMPFFDIEELMFNLIVPRFVILYYKYRHDRGDMNLTMYLMKKIATAINNHYVKSYNTFGCKVEHLIINEERKEKYYIMPKKIFSGVFASDALASFFRMKSSKTSVGIKDIPTFKTDKASLEELLQLNSYFVRDWMQYLGKDE